MSLDTSSWGTFRVGDIFIIRNGKGITKEEIENNPGDLIAVQSGEDDNGCIGKIDKQYVISNGYTVCEKPCLTVARSGSAGFVSYQKYGCVVGDSAKILELRENDAVSDNVMIFLQGLLTMMRFKYTYGRKVTYDKYASEIIKLPICADGSPDWDYMESYMKTLHHKPLTTKNKKENIVPLHPAEWKEFRVGELFECATTSAVLPDDMVEGSISYITRSSENNGNSGKLGNTEKVVQGNCITIGAEGAIAFYQPGDFIPGVKVYTLRHAALNEANAMFIVGVLNMEYYKYSYGRARVLEKLKNENIMLPVKDDGSPDWDYMEKYIKSLPYGDRV